jgi:hypothetical protein
MVEASEQQAGTQPGEKQRMWVTGDQLVGTVKRMAQEGTARRLILRKPSGQQVLEIPLVVGAAGAVVLPLWVALGTLGALATGYTLEVVRKDRLAKAPEPHAPAAHKPADEQLPPVH